jgi:type I restriction enzyme S subunit
MLEKKLVPKLRFAEFDGVWEIKRLGEIAKFSKGKNLSKIDITEEGLNECVRYGELYTTYNETIDEIHSRTNLRLEDSVLSKANDIIIPASGETQLDIATASCVLKDNVILGGDLNIIRTKNSGVFLSYYLNSKKKIDIARLSQGSSVIHLYSSQLSLLKLNIPQLPEQQKIASFLTEVDTKLSQLTKKKALLENYKKGVMQQIFSQEIRFKHNISTKFGASKVSEFPDWEEKKLGGISICMDNKRIPLNGFERNSKKGDVPYWGANGIVDHVNEYIFDETIVLLAEDGGYFDEFQNRPIANISHGKSWVNNHAHVIKAKQSLTTNEYLYYSLVHKNIMGYVNGGTRAKLNKSEMLQIKMIIPSSIEEQTKIANFLSDLDAKIEVLSTSIENTQTFKKGVLQQLFV